MTMKHTIIFTFLICLINNYCSDRISCFKKYLFHFNYPPQQLYQLNTITNFVTSDNYDSFKILAYGDFNSDLVTDFVALQKKNSQSVEYNVLAVYIWDPELSSFQQGVLIEQQQCTFQSIYLYDINSDGLLDLTISGQLTSSQQTQTNCMLPYLQQQSSPLSFTKGSILKISISSEPTIISYGIENNVNSVTGLLMYNTDTNKRVIMKYQQNLHQYISIKWNSTFINTSQGQQNIPFADPHWNSFFDFTGDCRADLVLITKSGNIQFWVNNGSKFYLYHQNDTLGQIVSLSFADMNYDGTADMVVAYPNRIEISQNKKSLSGSQQFCCAQCKQFQLLPPTTVITFPDNYLMGSQTLHIEDIDINGYPDLLFMLNNLTEGEYVKFPVVYLNVDGKQYTAQNQYKFKALINGEQQELTGDIVSVSYMDLLENGILDIMVVMKVHSENPQYQLFAFYNNILEQNSFFIKGYAASGKNASSGCLVNGGTFYWVNSIGNGIRTAWYPQIIQTAYNSLQLPYSYSGIGRANNYVQSFTMGIFGEFRSWSPIIPNSQLAVYATGAETSEWGIRIFVLPTQSLVYVVIVSTVILLIMGSVLILLKYKNHKKKEQPLMMDFIN